MLRLHLDLGYGLCYEDLYIYFSKYGKVTDLFLPRFDNGRNVGYGFVSVVSPSHQERRKPVLKFDSTIWIHNQPVMISHPHPISQHSAQSHSVARSQKALRKPGYTDRQGATAASGRHLHQSVGRQFHKAYTPQKGGESNESKVVLQVMFFSLFEWVQ